MRDEDARKLDHAAWKHCAARRVKEGESLEAAARMIGAGCTAMSYTFNRGIAMRRLGVDGHILTGKHLGGNVWLVNVIAHAAKRDPGTVYVVYSFDPGTAAPILNGPNIEHRALPFHAAIPRLLFYRPYAMLVHGLDALLTQYVAPPLALRPQIVVVHDVLFETNPEFFPLIMRSRLRLLVRMSVAWRA